MKDNIRELNRILKNQGINPLKEKIKLIYCNKFYY